MCRDATAGCATIMGSTTLSEPRRKRKRTARANASIRRTSSTAHKQPSIRRTGIICCFGAAVSLPCVAVLFGLTMTLITGVSKALKSSARDAAKAGRWDASVHPLAVLLEEQHEIDSQVPLLLLSKHTRLVVQQYQSYTCTHVAHRGLEIPRPIQRFWIIKARLHFIATSPCTLQ